MKKKPVIFLIFKLLGLVGVVIFLIGVVNLIKGFGNFEDNSYIIGIFIMPFGLILGVTGLVMGFKPEITKHSIKTANYIQEENKEELQEMMSRTAEINSEAVTTTVEAVNRGLKETMYCKHCGQVIDIDSQFCKHCGQKL